MNKVTTKEAILAMADCYQDGVKDASEELASELTLLGAENERLRKALKIIRDGFDCDSDAHKYRTPCRCCMARAALEGRE